MDDGSLRSMIAILDLQFDEIGTSLAAKNYVKKRETLVNQIWLYEFYCALVSPEKSAVYNWNVGLHYPEDS